MPIPVKCKCGKQISAPDKLAGKQVKCPSCDEVLSIPAAGTPAPKPKATGTAIPVKCDCGKTFAAPAKLAGKVVKCPACQKPIKVPTGAGQGSPKVASTIKGTCTSCGKSFNAPAKLAGKKVGCPSCKAPVQLPGGALAPAAAAPTPAVATGGGIDEEMSVGSLLDEIGFQQAAAQNRCPECKADLEPDAVLCIHCGYHLETGKKLETKTVQKKSKQTSSMAPAAKPSPKQAANLEKLKSAKKMSGLCLGMFIFNLLFAVLFLVVVGVGGIAQIRSGDFEGSGVSSGVSSMLGAAVPALQIVGLLFYLLTPVALFRLGNHMKGQTTAIVIAVLSLIPCLNIILLAWFHSQAVAMLKKAGMS